MGQVFNFYCDESCHLEHDGLDIMTLGAVWCPAEKAHESAVRLREIKQKHGLNTQFELKWVKVSPAKIGFYQEVMDYFFDDDDLRFRALIVPDKLMLNHAEFGHSHDDWYYKMYFDMLKVILSPHARNHIYLDYKDTQGGKKVKHLHDVLCNNVYDFSRQVIERVQIVRSHEVELLQLTDLLLGAVSYANRALETSSAKRRLVARMRERSHYSLTHTTLLREEKTNLFRWQASWGQ
ncbi:MAG: hypothetical protein JWN14_1323 [Chthonomonadales bacterium]|nr:hypothetical protein [Chthonomonadales bacterium]